MDNRVGYAGYAARIFCISLHYRFTKGVDNWLAVGESGVEYSAVGESGILSEAHCADR